MSRKIRMGMIGGSLDALIGGVHRLAANLDGQIELVCGAFSSNPEKSKLTGESLYLPENRVYGSYSEMILAEKELSVGERMDFVSIVTPNHVHFPPAKMALENGFHVMMDKPLTLNLTEAVELKNIVEKSGLQFGLTHNYTAYPMVKEAKALVKNGKIGKIRKVIVEYPQGWLSNFIDNKQASWRTDPAKSGEAGSLGDIGTHAENLAEYITGLKIIELSADLSTFVPGRQLDDDVNILLRFESGAKGILHNSQICNGEENDLNIRIYGETGGLKWRQMEPNTLIYTQQNMPAQYIRTGVGELSAHAKAHTRVPGGHPEGFIEAFANLYRNYVLALKANYGTELQLKSETKHFNPEIHDFPGINDGLRGMQFIKTALKSNVSENKWTKFEN